MSRLARQNYAWFTLVVGVWMAVLWGTDVRIAITVSCLATLAAGMNTHYEMSRRCEDIAWRGNVSDEDYLCGLLAGHSGTCVSKEGYRRKAKPEPKPESSEPEVVIPVKTIQNLDPEVVAAIRAKLIESPQPAPSTLPSAQFIAALQKKLEDEVVDSVLDLAHKPSPPHESST